MRRTLVFRYSAALLFLTFLLAFVSHHAGLVDLGGLVSYSDNRGVHRIGLKTSLLHVRKDSVKYRLTNEDILRGLGGYESWSSKIGTNMATVNVVKLNSSRTEQHNSSVTE
jgi:hypothetical protein